MERRGSKYLGCVHASGVEVCSEDALQLVSKQLVHQELLLVIQESLGISLEREEYLVQESDFDVTTKEFLIETIQGLYGVHKDQRIELLVCKDVLQVHGGESHIRRISPVCPLQSGQYRSGKHRYE